MRLTKLSSLTRMSLFLLTLLISFFLISQSSTIAAVQNVRSLAFTALSSQSSTTKDGLYTIKADGSSLRHLAPTIKDGSIKSVWSPNGQRLAFSANFDGDVYVINADGSRLTKLFSAQDGCKTSNVTITWLSNNQKLAFSRDCDYYSFEAPSNNSLYLSDTTSTQKTQLIKQWEIWPQETPQGSQGLGLKSNLSVSPDGTQVVFIQDRELYKMNTNGSGLTKLPNPTELPNDDKPEWSWLTWSPDGTRIAWIYGQAPQTKFFLLSTDGKLLAQAIADGTDWYNNPVWSPDSKRVAYYYSETEDSANQQTIYLLDVEGGIPQKLTQKPGDYSAISWSPNGKKIAFTFTDSDKPAQLYLIDVDGKNLTELSPPSKFGVSNAQWSSDGQKLAITASDNNENILVVVNRDGSGWSVLTNALKMSAFNPVWQP